MVKATVKAYLAHTFGHRKFVKEVLTPKVNAIGIMTRNPFYESDGSTKRPEVAMADKADIHGLSTASDIAKSSQCKEQAKWTKMVVKNSEKIVTRDLEFIDHTDFTVAYLTELSKGTSDEIFYTGVIKRRPVYLLCDKPELSNHPWLIYECRFGKICKTLDELLRVLKKRYG
jgi:hypothetical protein